MKLFHNRHSRLASPRAFTIIEIALCLGIIGFALVAIIAVLPRGLDVQKRNREETIIGQNADVWINSLRGGGRGFDELTNYVKCITNFWTTYRADYTIANSGYDYYTPTSSSVTSLSPSPGTYALTNGARIIGLLSMPKFTPTLVNRVPLPNPPYQSNYVVAYVRAFSGAAVDMAPQTNDIVRGDSFTYRMVVENFPYAPVDTNSFCLECDAALATNGMTSAQIADWWQGRTNLMRTVWMMQTNVSDFRLLFRWPVLPNGTIPSYGYATFRAMADGMLLQTNDPPDLNQPLYFVQPSLFLAYTNAL